MMQAIKVDFDDAAFKQFAATLGEPQLLSAARRATKKAAGWMHTQVSRQVADEAKFPRRFIKVTRGKVYDKGWRRGGGSGYAYKVWLGLNPVVADKLGTPRKLVKGYAVGKHRFRDAFMPGKGRYAGKLYRRTTRSRLPIQRVRVEWESIGRKAFLSVMPRLQVRYRELMLQELRFEALRAAGMVKAGSARWRA